MDARYLTAGMLAGLLLAGCQSGGNTELMERELRLQEDRIYWLEDELARCGRAMQACQQETATAAAPTPARRTAPVPPPGAPATPPNVELEMPAAPVPGPLNGMPSLFQSQPQTETSQETALRIRRPEASPSVVTDAKRQAVQAPIESASPPVRMRFASAADADPTTTKSRVVMEWSSATPDDSASPPPRGPVSIGAAPRRPSWSPYR